MQEMQGRPPTPVDFQTSPSNPSPAAAEVAGPQTAGPLHLEHMLLILLLHILCQKVTITCLRVFSLRWQHKLCLFLLSFRPD